MNNPTRERRGMICVACSKKFLYRDAMHEYAVKLEQKEGTSETQQEELEFNEDKYNRLMTDLTELKEMKHQKSNDILLKKQEVNFQQEKLLTEIERLRREKDNLITKQQLVRKEEEDKAKKIEAITIDIQKGDRNVKLYMEKVLNKTHDITVYKQLLIDVKAKH